MESCFCCGSTPKNNKKAEEMIAVVSHDLRAPLTSIQFALELLDLELQENSTESAKEELSIAKRNAARLIKMIDSLLGAEKIRNQEWTVTPERVNLSSLVDNAVDSLLPLARSRNITIKRYVSEFESTGFVHRFVEADGDKIMQVVLNLLSNAIKFSPDHGVITVSARQVGKSVEVSIEDQGPGIPAEACATIFEPYVQVERPGSKKPGVGLGLAICKEIVVKHSGSIGVRSRKEGGSTFWFCIPLSVPKNVSVSASTSAADSPTFAAVANPSGAELSLAMVNLSATDNAISIIDATPLQASGATRIQTPAPVSAHWKAVALPSVSTDDPLSDTSSAPTAASAVAPVKATRQASVLKPLAACVARAVNQSELRLEGKMVLFHPVMVDVAAMTALNA